MSTVSATAAYRNARIRLLTMKSGSTYGPTAISSDAPTPNSATERRSERRAGTVGAATVLARTLLTCESLWPEAQNQGREHHDSEAAENRVAIGADQHLCTAEH